MQNFIEIIESRGFVHQFTDREGLNKLLAQGPQSAYIGFDCTAKSLHVGSLLQIMLLRWWQKCGHKPIVLLGGGTTKIGDPSGKDESRPALNDAQIQENMDSLKQVFSQFLDFSNNQSSTPETAAIMVNNDDWLSGLNYPQFLRDYGRHFSVNRMLTMDSVKLRLEREQPLSFLEFNYMILQAYDFVELNKRHNCRVQLGGSDQWGNIVNGVELNRRLFSKHEREDVRDKGLSDKDLFEAQRNLPHDEIFKERTENGLFGITSPLLTTASGAKMGKTAAGAVWLNADMLKPYDYWQFWRNTEDADVARFLKLFTELSLPDIATLMAGNINTAKQELATHATAMLHGADEAARAAQTAADIFSGKGVSENMPELHISAAELAAGAPLAALLVSAGFAASNGEAKRLIKGNGVRVNDAVVAKEDLKLSDHDLTSDGFIKLSKGKKQHVLVRVG